MICYIPECISYGSENFGLGSLHDDCVGVAGVTLQFYFVLCLDTSKGNEEKTEFNKKS
jgi:hypothetical protein